MGFFRPQTQKLFSKSYFLFLEDTMVNYADARRAMGASEIFTHVCLETTRTTGKKQLILYSCATARHYQMWAFFAHKPKSCFQKVVSYS